MSKVAILILAYKRSEELQKVIDSVQKLNPSCIYFHLHDKLDEDGEFEVDSVKSVIKAYTGEKKVLYVKEYLGCYKAMKSALKWVSGFEDKFYVFEDDVVLDKVDTNLTRKYDALESGILKFGASSQIPAFWGWAVTSDVAKQIAEFDIEEVTDKDVKGIVQVDFFVGWKELCRRGLGIAWDDETAIICKMKGINVVCTDKVYTTHIGVVSSQEKPKKGQILHVTYQNGKLIN
jgi:hypothetical protein